MATAIENYHLAQSLFDPMRQSVGRYLDTQATIAQQAQQLRRQREMLNLKRAQELEDQAAEARLKTSIANIAVQGQIDVEASRAKRDDARFASALSREEAKAAEAERKANIARVKEAYAKYRAAGGTEKITTFGAEDDQATFYAIQDALGAKVGENERTQFGTLANLLREREQEIVAITMPTEDEVAAITSQAIQNIALVPGLEDAAEMYNKLAAKVDSATAIDQVSLKYPAFARALKTNVTAGVSALRAEKAKSPEFIRNLQGYQAERSAVTKAALESPFGGAFFEGLKTPAVEPKAAPKAADLSNLKIDRSGRVEAGNVDLFKQPRVANPKGGTSTVYSQSFNFDGKEYLLPSVTPDGRLLSTPDEVVAQFKKTGKHLGVFKDAASANSYAKQLHDEYESGKYDTVQPAAPSGYGGAIGLFEGYGGRLRNLLDIARLTTSNVAEVPASMLNLAAGGMKRVEEGFNEREAARQKLIQLYNLRNPGSELSTDPLFAR